MVFGSVTTVLLVWVFGVCLLFYSFGWLVLLDDYLISPLFICLLHSFENFVVV